LGSKFPNFTFAFAAFIIPRAERGVREALKHEYDSVKIQYLAIKDANARKAFIKEREEFVNSWRIVRKFTHAKAIVINACMR
jgi:hypothetical protein